MLEWWSEAAGLASCVRACPECGAPVVWRGNECRNECTGCALPWSGRQTRKGWSSLSRADAWWRQAFQAGTAANEAVRGIPGQYATGPGMVRAVADGERRSVWAAAASVRGRGAPVPGVLRAGALGDLARSGGGEAAPIFRTVLGTNSTSSRNAWNNAPWMDAVEAYTSEHRRNWAFKKFWKKALQRSKWHEDRYRGQSERFDSVRQCGMGGYMLDRIDPQTGEIESRELRHECGCWRVCRRCQGRRKRAQQDAAAAVHKRWLREHRVRLNRSCGPEGRWSEKMFSLTIPHSGDPHRDARSVVKAWAILRRKIANHLRADRGMGPDSAQPVWFRSIEITAGRKNDGHAHCHVWWLGPWLDHVLLRAWWGQILETMGYKVPHVSRAKALAESRDTRMPMWLATRRGVHGRALETVPWPVMDARAFKGKSATSEMAAYAAKGGLELVKYVAKSGGMEVRSMHPAVAALLYQALEGSRCVVWSIGAREKKPPSEWWWKVRRPSDDERAVWDVPPMPKLPREP